MKTGTRRGSCMLVCALLLTVAACTDSDKPTPTGAQAVRLHASGDADDDDNGAAGICGVIAETKVITENTRLTCDVECTNLTGPCIQFGRPNITLWLNGFTMTGRASPPANCAANPGAGNPFDGISTAGFDRVRIRGPGMVQRFRRHGIFVVESERVKVERVTSHFNCFSGIFLGLANDNDISENVSVRNGAASGIFPCGGNCISSSNDNRIRRNHYYGNGSVASGAPLGTPNDFGVGLVGTSRDNIIEDNSIGGNINGVLIVPTAVANLIRRNVIAGNPPVQLSVTSGPEVGVDIRDASPANANTFDRNHCITYEGASTEARTGRPPCPNFPRSRSQD
jgi:Periplasmic copper-binding protein (NosD)